jgi:hypothetical protein
MATGYQVTSTVAKYTFYNMIKNYRGTDQRDIRNNILNGGMAGVMSTCFIQPFDVAKINQQQGISFVQLLKEHGSKVMFRGLPANLTRSVGTTALVFPTYDFYNSYLHNYWLASFGAAITSCTILQPVDYIKVRQVSGLPLFQGYNLLNYYRGFHLNLLRTVPHFMLAMGITEMCKKFVYLKQ